MAQWLLKTEPESYSWDDLVRQKKATWNGVSNPVALKHLRSMKKGDQALIYHTGKEKRIVGLAQIVSNPYPDPKENDERLVVGDIRPQLPLERPVALEAIKADPIFAEWELVRISRLSV